MQNRHARSLVDFQCSSPKETLIRFVNVVAQSNGDLITIIQSNGDFITIALSNGDFVTTQSNVTSSPNCNSSCSQNLLMHEFNNCPFKVITPMFLASF